MPGAESGIHRSLSNVEPIVSSRVWAKAGRAKAGQSDQKEG